jgi:(2Fe-2S) ferredoxin
MARFKHILFVCQNERELDNPKGSCKQKGSDKILSRMKELVTQHNLKGKVRVTSSGCLDLCAKGCAIAAFSEGQPETWYTRVKVEDADAIFESHVLRGERLVRLVDQ